MDSLVGKIALGIIRHFVVGGFASLSLYMSKQDQSADVTAVMTLVVSAFSVYDKIQAQNKLNAAKGVAS